MSVLSNGKGRTVVKSKQYNYVAVDTCYTFDRGWETMVFPCDKNGNILSWLDLDAMLYSSRQEAAIGHVEMVNKWRVN